MLLLVRIQQWEDNTSKTEPLFAQLLNNLHEQLRGAKISFELASINQHVYFFVVTPRKLRELVIGQIYSIFPDAVIEEQKTDYADDSILKQGHLLSARLAKRRPDIYPWKRYDEFEGDSLAGLFTVMSKSEEGQQLWAQVVVQPIRDDLKFNFRRSVMYWINRFRKLVRIRDFIKARGQKDFRKREKDAISKKSEERQYKVSIRLAAIAKDETKAHGQLTALLQAYAQFNTIDHNGFSVSKRSKGEAALKRWKSRSMDDASWMSISELAGMYHFPDPDIVPHIVHVMARRSEPPMDLPKSGENDVIPFGLTNYHNQQIPFGLLRKDRARHLYAESTLVFQD